MSKKHLLFLIAMPWLWLEADAIPLKSDWLERLNAAYEAMFIDWKQCPLIRLDCAQFDLRRPDTIQKIATMLLGPKPAGKTANSRAEI